MFEAYTDPNEVDLTEGDGSIMTDEEKVSVSLKAHFDDNILLYDACSQVGVSLNIPK